MSEINNLKAKKKCIRITENDIEILRLINKYGIIKKSKLSDYFSKQKISYKNSYIPKRLRILKDFNYLKDFGRGLGLGLKGKRELELRNIELIYKRDFRKDSYLNIYKSSSLLLDMDFKFKMSRREFIMKMDEEEKSNQVVKLYDGVVWNAPSEKFFVYSFKEDINHLDLSKIKKDLEFGGIKNVILVFDNIKYFKKTFERLRELIANKILIIPNNSKGINSLNLYNSNLFSDENLIQGLNKISKKIDAKKENSEMKFFNSIGQNIMILDIKKLSKSLSLLRMRKESKIYFSMLDIYQDFAKDLKEDLASDNIDATFLMLSEEQYLNAISD